MDDMKKQAEELGIKIDGRWSEERLQQEIDKALNAPVEVTEQVEKTQERMVTVRVMRDFWAGEPGNAQRVRKGSIVDVPVEAALDGVESGALSRVK